MDYLHVVNGDPAARLLSAALNSAGRRDRIVVLRDDLTVGPLRGIDESNQARVAFWQRALGASEHDISQTIIDAFDASAAALHELVEDHQTEVVAWHAQNAGDQLMLRRIAYHLRTMPQRLNEIGIQARGLICASSGEALDEVCSPAALQARLHTIAPISILRITRLALEWQEQKQFDHELRRWRDNTFQTGLLTDIDAAILDQTGPEWQSYLQLAQRIRDADTGSIASDTIIAWRCRELAGHGRLLLDNDPIINGRTQVRQP